MNDNIYDIDLSKLSVWLTPVRLRIKKYYVFIQAIVAPFIDIHNRFIVYKNDVNYRIGITAQVVHLQRGLNDRFDIAERRIRIVPAKEYLPVLLGLKAENKPRKLGTKDEPVQMKLPLKSETLLYSFDFIIEVPFTLAFDTDEMKAFVNKYKLESKNYGIQKV